MNAQVVKAGVAVHRDPVAAGKTLLFLLLAIVLIYLVWKFVKGVSKTTDFIGDAMGSTEEERRDIVLSPVYQDGIKWLDPSIALKTLIDNKYKDVTQYFAQKKLTIPMLQGVADQIYKARFSGANLIGIDSLAVYNAFASLPSKVAVSFMAYEWKQTWEKTVLKLSLAAFLSKFMSAKQMETLTELIHKKPLL